MIAVRVTCTISSGDSQQRLLLFLILLHLQQPPKTLAGQVLGRLSSLPGPLGLHRPQVRPQGAFLGAIELETGSGSEEAATLTNERLSGS